MESGGAKRFPGNGVRWRAGEAGVVWGGWLRSDPKPFIYESALGTHLLVRLFWNLLTDQK